MNLAVVTGASSGIGSALASELAARGYPLMLVARRRDRLEDLAGKLRERHGVAVLVRPCDLADRERRAELVAELADHEIAVLCANAGFPSCGHLADGDERRLAEEVEVNVVALHGLVRAVLPGMLRLRAGHVLITGSTAGEQPVPTAATYAATKAFANSLAQSLHAELRGTGVGCTLLSPGPVRTEFYRVGGIAGIESRRWLRWLTAEQVARAGVAGMVAGNRVVIPGVVAKAQAITGRYTPRWALFPLLRWVFVPALRPPRGARRDGRDTGVTE